MEDLLSRDLPTKERERNPIPIWWMAAMLLPLCLGVGYYIGVKTATKAITHQQITKSVKKQLDLVNHSGDQPRTDLEQVFTSRSRNNSNLFSSGSFSSLLAMPPLVEMFSRYDTKQVSSTNDANIGVESNISDINNLNSVTLNPPLETRQDVLGTVTVPKIPDLAIIPNNTDSSTGVIGSIAEKENLLSPPMTPVPEMVSNFSKWRWGMSVFLSTERFSSLNGLGAGVLTEWQIIKRLGIRTGILYTLYKPTKVSQPIVKIYDWDYARATGNNSLIQQGSAPSASNLDPYVFVPVSRLHRLEIPFSFHWSATPEWKLITGAYFSYTYYGQSADKNFADDKVLRVNAIQSEKKVNQLATDKLTSWQADFQTGISFNPTKRTELAVYYRRPFNSFINKSAVVGESSTLDAHRVDGKLTGNYMHKQLLTLSSTLFF